jgi:hypothetical protein
MEPLSIAGYLTFLVCTLIIGVQSLKERHDYTTFWSTHD